MSDPRHLVPTLAQCKKIPRGCFDDSALVWVLGCTPCRTIIYSDVRIRNTVQENAGGIDEIYPAPTAQEVLNAIYKCHWSLAVRHGHGDVWSVSVDTCLGRAYEVSGRNLAQCAMTLWLGHCRSIYVEE